MTVQTTIHRGERIRIQRTIRLPDAEAGHDRIEG